MDTNTYLDKGTYTTTAASDGTGHGDGALADLYIGANGYLAPRFLVGAQLEGTISEMTFGSTNNRHKTASTRRSSSTYASTDNDDTYLSRDSNKSKQNSTDIYYDPTDLQLDWMVSVIGRAGYLATPTTLLYGLAGWSYGHFEVENIPYDFGLGKIQEFDANGPTVGGGIEKMLSPKWSLKAEYRYTNFGSQRLSAKDASTYSSSESGSGKGSDSQSSTCCGSSNSSSTETDTDIDTNSYTSRASGSIDNDMHVGRIGITRYFNLGN